MPEVLALPVVHDVEAPQEVVDAPCGVSPCRHFACASVDVDMSLVGVRQLDEPSGERLVPVLQIGVLDDEPDRADIRHPRLIAASR